MSWVWLSAEDVKERELLYRDTDHRAFHVKTQRRRRRERAYLLQVFITGSFDLLGTNRKTRSVHTVL